MFEFYGLVAARVIDQNIDTAKGPDHRLDGRPNAFRVCDIAANRHTMSRVGGRVLRRYALEFTNRLLSFFFGVQKRYCNLGARFRQSQRRGFAQALGRSSD